MKRIGKEISLSLQEIRSLYERYIGVMSYDMSYREALVLLVKKYGFNEIKIMRQSIGEDEGLPIIPLQEPCWIIERRKKDETNNSNITPK